MKNALIVILVIAILICVIILAFSLFNNDDNATTKNEGTQETTPEEAAVNTSDNEATTPEPENSQTTTDKEQTGETTRPEPTPSPDETTNTTPDGDDEEPEDTSTGEDTSTTPGGGAAPVIPPEENGPPQLTEDGILMLSAEVQNTDMFIGMGVYVDKGENFPYVAGQRIQGAPRTNQAGATDYYFDQFHSVCVIGGWDLYESKISSTTNMVYANLSSTSLIGGGSGFLLEGKYVDVGSKNKEVYFGLIYEGKQGPYLVVSGSSILTDELCVGFASTSINDERTDCMVSVTSYIGELADSIQVSSYIDGDMPSSSVKISSVTIDVSNVSLMELNDYSAFVDENATFCALEFITNGKEIYNRGIESIYRGYGVTFEYYILGTDGIAYKVYFTLG